MIAGSLLALFYWSIQEKISGIKNDDSWTLCEKSSARTVVSQKWQQNPSLTFGNETVSQPYIFTYVSSTFYARPSKEFDSVKVQSTPDKLTKQQSFFV